MSAGPIKHSLTLKGHRTSVSLEAAFWQAFREIAAERGLTLNQLASDIDAKRRPDEGLASAIRLFILQDLQLRLAQSAISAASGAAASAAAASEPTA